MNPIDIPPAAPTVLFKWLRAVRVGRRINLLQVGNATGYPIVDVSRFERGAAVPDALYLRRFSRYFGAIPPPEPTAADELAALVAVSSYDGAAVLVPVWDNSRPLACLFAAIEYPVSGHGYVDTICSRFVSLPPGTSVAPRG